MNKTAQQWLSKKKRQIFFLPDRDQYAYSATFSMREEKTDKK